MELEEIGVEGLDDIYIISTARKEFVKAINEEWKDTPPWKRFQKQLIRDLAVLQKEKEKAIDLESFERIVGADDIFCIRHPKTKKNVRILYMITEDKAVIILTAFLEKSTKDYSLAIKKAKNRLKWLYEE